MRLQEHSRRFDAAQACALQRAFVVRCFPKNKKNLRQKECAAVSAWMHVKHGDQAAPLPGASATATNLCGASAHIGLFEEPRISVWGHRGRTGEALDLGRR